jgi:mRNA interferase RelE/StbE
MKTIVFTATAAKDFDALPERARDAITRALTAYAVHGLGDVKRLVGRDGFRLRVGDYRVLFDEDQTTILAIAVGRRATTTYRRT